VATSIETLSWEIIPPWGGTLPCDTVSFSDVVNKGIEARWHLPRHALVSAQTWGEEDPWKVHVKNSSSGAAWTEWYSPELYVGQDEYSLGVGGDTHDFLAVDKFSFRATTSGVTIPTLDGKTVAQVIAAICNGITIDGVVYYGARIDNHIVNGASATSLIREFDVQGNEFGSYLARIARDYAMGMRMNWNRVNGTGLQLEFTDPSSTTTYTGLGLQSRIWTNRATRSRNKSQTQTRIYLKKVSKQATKYTFNIDAFGPFTGEVPGGLMSSSIQLFDQSTSGYLWYLAGWQAPSQGGLLAWWYGGPPWNPGPAPPSNPAGGDVYSISGYLYPPPGATPSTKAVGIIVLTGIPPGMSGYDVAFEKIYPTIPGGQTPEQTARERKAIIESPLWQTEALAETLKQYLFWEVNKGADVVKRDVRFDPHIPAGYLMVSDDFLPQARYDSVEWSLGSGAPSMTMTGWVPAN